MSKKLEIGLKHEFLYELNLFLKGLCEFLKLQCTAREICNQINQIRSTEKARYGPLRKICIVPP